MNCSADSTVSHVVMDDSLSPTSQNTLQGCLSQQDACLETISGHNNHVQCPAENLTHKLNINDLPDSILLAILSFLSRSDHLKIVALVCRYWNALTQDPMFWRNCNLQNQAKLDDVILGRVTSYSANVKLLDLSHCPLVTDDGLLNVMDRCSSLLILKLARIPPRYFEPEVVETKSFTERSLISIGVNFRQLYTIDLTRCSTLTDKALIEIANNCPQLATLGLRCCDGITDKSMFVVARKCLQLRDLVIDHCKKLTARSLVELTKKGRKRCKLNSLSTRGVFNSHAKRYISRMADLKKLSFYQEIISHVTLVSIASGCSTLTYLDLQECQYVTNTTVYIIVERLQSLQALNLSGCDFDDEGMKAIKTLAGSLQAIEINRCEWITGYGINEVLKGLPQLRFMGLGFNDKSDISNKEEADDLNAEYPHIHVSWCCCFLGETNKWLTACDNLSTPGPYSLVVKHNFGCNE